MLFYFGYPKTKALVCNSYYPKKQIEGTTSLYQF